MYKEIEPFALKINMRERLEKAVRKSFGDMKDYNLQNIVDSRYRMGLRLAKEEGTTESFETILLDYLQHLEKEYGVLNGALR